MTIEFPCPYCSAIIRVPDNAGGGKGRCPKCATRITVPKKSPVKLVAKSVVDDEPLVLEVAEVEAPEQPSAIPVAPQEPAEVNESAPVTFDPAALSRARLGELPVERPTPVISVKRSLKKGKQKHGSGVWMTTGIVVLLLMAVAGYFAYPKLVLERLSGDLIAGSAATLELPPTLIDKSRFKYPPDDVARLLSRLELNPVPLNSTSMQILLAGSDKGLRISIAAGSHAHFYRVSLKENEAVQKFLSRHLGDLEAERTKNVNQTATDFLIAYEKVLEKKTSSDSLVRFRDSLALASLVGGFGQELVVVYDRGLYRCAYEDTDGGLYFLLPEGIKEFEVISLKHADGTTIVPAEFKVKVQGGIAGKSSENSSNPPQSKSATNDADTDKSDDVEMAVPK